MQKRWVLKAQGSPELSEKLSKELNISPVLSTLLQQRGVTDFDSAKKFFRPQLTDLYDPFLMKDMDRAIERVDKAVSENQKILVYGDYDVDGTTSVALMYSFLKSFYPHVEYYIPDRYKEGYGISTQGIDYAKANDFALIIALDCGIKSVDKIAYANTLGVDFIICDHHLPGDEIPDASAVLDPKRKDCDYPFKELSGCGVGFKLAQAYCLKHDLPLENVYQYLDLLAVSIAADMVLITDENRVFTFYGLLRVNEQPRPGIKAILDLSNFKKELTVTDIVFMIGPRINAAGRIGDAKNAVELLISETAVEAENCGNFINERNTERKFLDTSITEHALHLIEEDDSFGDKRSTVLFHPEWHKGVIGIVASRLIEKYYRPTIILTESNGLATGSARSVKDFDVYNAIESCSDLLEQFGGHKYAAGLTMKLENVPAFVQKFEDVVSSTIEERMLTQEIEIDAEIELQDITPSFFKILKQLGPFGPGNMVPVFKTCQVTDKGFAKVVGTNHLKLSVTKESEELKLQRFFDAIGFQLARYYDNTLGKQPFDICYNIEENEWNGQISLQLNVKDIKY